MSLEDIKSNISKDPVFFISKAKAVMIEELSIITDKNQLPDIVVWIEVQVSGQHILSKPVNPGFIPYSKRS